MPAPHPLLDHLIYQLVAADASGARQVIRKAVTAGASVEEMIARCLYPALVCLLRSREQSQMTRRSYNASRHILEGLAAQLFRDAAPQPDHGRSVFICNAPHETEELGAKFTADLAALHGWRVRFGGAGLRTEEIAFALGRFNPDVLLLHCDHTATLAALRSWILCFHDIAPWPALQIAVAGAAVDVPDTVAQALYADVAGSDPVDILETLTLCPHQRAAPAAASRALPSTWDSRQRLGWN